VFVLGLEKDVRKIVPLKLVAMPVDSIAIPMLKRDHYLACGVEIEGGQTISLMENVWETMVMVKVFSGRCVWYDLDAEAITKELGKVPEKYQIALMRQWSSSDVVINIIPAPSEKVIIITMVDQKGVFGNEARMILVFTTEEKASEYMVKAGFFMGYTLPLSWAELVNQYGQFFKFALMDPLPCDEQFNVVLME